MLKTIFDTTKSLVFLPLILLLCYCDKKSPLPDRQGELISGKQPVATRPIGLPNSETTHNTKLEKIQLDILNFGKNENLTDKEYALYKASLGELAAKYPREACEILASGLAPQSYQVKIAMFSIMMENFDSSVIIPLFEDLVKGRGTNSQGSETSEALSMALGKASDNLKFASVIKLLFEGNGAETHISYYFTEAGKINGSDLASNLDSFDLSGRQKDAAVLAIAFSISGDKPDDAARLLDTLDAGFAGSAYGRILGQLLEKDPERAQRMFLDLDDTKLQGALRYPDLMRALSKSENIGLLENALQRYSLTKANSATFGTLIKNMLTLDRSQAISVLDQLPDSSLRSEMIQDIWKDTNVNSLNDALDAISTLPENSKADSARGLAMRLALLDQDTAIKFIEQSPVSMQSRLVADVIDEAVAASPVNAVSIFDREMASGRLKPEEGSAVATHISFAYANHNVLQAKSWAEKLPSNYQPGAFRGLMESWGRSDPAGASKWLATVPAGPSRDAGARALVNEIESTDTQMAAKWKQTYER